MAAATTENPRPPMQVIVAEPVEARVSAARRRLVVWSWRLVVVVVVLGLWEFLPHIPALRDSLPVFDPFFISSPSRVGVKIFELATGSNAAPYVWPYLGSTLLATMLGLVIGSTLGALFGLLLSNSPTLANVLRPFITLVNATPRIALIPIFIIIFGPTLTSAVLTSVFVVFFLVFYSAYSGGLSVQRETLESSQLLGASRAEVMGHVRMPYVMAWTFTSLPNAVSFSLIAVVTTEILTGQSGVGGLLVNAIAIVDSTLTFSLVVLLSVLGVILVALTDFLQNKILHWWGH